MACFCFFVIPRLPTFFQLDSTFFVHQSSGVPRWILLGPQAAIDFIRHPRVLTPWIGFLSFLSFVPFFPCVLIYHDRRWNTSPMLLADQAPLSAEIKPLAWVDYAMEMIMGVAIDLPTSKPTYLPNLFTLSSTHILHVSLFSVFYVSRIYDIASRRNCRPLPEASSIWNGWQRTAKFFSSFFSAFPLFDLLPSPFLAV